MEIHVITASGSELIMRVVEGQAVIVPPPAPTAEPAGAPVAEAPGK